MTVVIVFKSASYVKSAGVFEKILNCILSEDQVIQDGVLVLVPLPDNAVE